MAPAMTTRSRIAGERANRSGDFFTAGFGGRKLAGEFPTDGTATARPARRGRHHRSADGDGR